MRFGLIFTIAGATFNPKPTQMTKTKNRSGFNFPVNDEQFKKSTWSQNNPKTCVMVAVTEEGVALRDSKDLTKQTLYFNHDEWTAFVKGVKTDEFVG